MGTFPLILGGSIFRQSFDSIVHILFSSSNFLPPGWLPNVGSGACQFVKIEYSNAID